MGKLVYFKGYYGFKNIGDDIFCITADWLCKEMLNDKKAIVIGENLPNLSSNIKKFNIKNYWLRKAFEFFLIFNSDYIIFFGGSLFHRIGGIRDIKFILEKLPIFYRKLIAIGISIGPFKSQDDYESIKNFLSKFNNILVRDISSIEIIKDMKVNVKYSFSFDLAILINKVFPTLKLNSDNNLSLNKREKIKIGVSLCHYERYVGGNLNEEEMREKAVFAFIDSIIKKYKNNIDEIVFFEFNGSRDKGDFEITQHFYNKIKNNINSRIVNYTKDTEKFINELNACDFVIGMRLHSGILAYALNIPFMLVEYHKKCTEFLNTINHNFRFDIENQAENLKNFDILLEKREIPNIKKPKFFEDIMMRELKLLFQDI